MGWPLLLQYVLVGMARDGTYIEGWVSTDFDDIPSSTYVPASTFVPSFHELEEVKKMKYRKLPHFGLVSVVGLSASRLGDIRAKSNDPFLPGEVEQATEMVMMFLKV